MLAVIHSKTTFLICVLLSLTACGPQYRTFVSYAPPESAEGRACLASCQGMRMACRQQKGEQVQECRRNAETQAQLESIRRIAEYAVSASDESSKSSSRRLPRDAKPNYSACAAQDRQIEGQCTADHDLCYQNCGGHVTYSTQCVANCE
jgi:hypothetical protein